MSEGNDIKSKKHKSIIWIAAILIVGITAVAVVMGVLKTAKDKQAGTPPSAATETPAPQPTATSEPTPQPTETSAPAPQPTATGAPTPQPTATSVPTLQPTATSEPTPQPTATSAPTPRPTATSAPTPTPMPEYDMNYIKDITKAKVGDYILFGAYEQNAKEDGLEAIEWEVLDKQDGKLLLISRYILDDKQFGAERSSCDWNGSLVRTWLNREFYQGAFNEEEAECILVTSLKDASTEDKVFLLSLEEATTYGDADKTVNDKRRCAKVTKYVKSIGGYYNDDDEYYENGRWWLRTSSEGSGVVIVRHYGSCWNYAPNDDMGVRPVVWIDAKKAEQSDPMMTGTAQERNLYVPIPAYDTPDAKLVLTGRNVKVEEAQIGDSVLFGSFEQDNVTENGAEAIEWIVLDKQEDRILILSKYGLDSRKYNEERVNVTWENCTLRQWLNREFYESAFTKDEKKHIPTVHLKNEDNLIHGTDGGKDTFDRVFLLSEDELQTYFSSDVHVKDVFSVVSVTDFAEANEGYRSKWPYYVGNGIWWLRSPGQVNLRAACVGMDGAIYLWNEVNDGTKAVRPAMWISMSEVE